MAGTKRVTFNVRVSEDVARAMDEARAGQSRASWVAGVIDAALASGGDPAVDSRPGPEKREQAAETGRCTHPRVRVLKGFCYACGMSASV